MSEWISIFDQEPKEGQRIIIPHFDQSCIERRSKELSGVYYKFCKLQRGKFEYIPGNLIKYRMNFDMWKPAPEVKDAE